MRKVFIVGNGKPIEKSFLTLQISLNEDLLSHFPLFPSLITQLVELGTMGWPFEPHVGLGPGGKYFFLVSKTPFPPMEAPHPEWECKQNSGNPNRRNPLQEEAVRGGISCQWINSLAPETKVLIDTASQYLPRELERVPPTALSLMQATRPQSTVLAGHQSRAPSKFRALRELVTLVVIAHLELQLCLERSPQSRLGSPVLFILGAPLLALIWEPY